MMGDLSADLQSFLAECEAEFTDRYSDSDAEYIKHCQEVKLHDVPIEDRWFTRPPRQFDRRDEGRRDRWEDRGNRGRSYNRDYQGERDGRDYNRADRDNRGWRQRDRYNQGHHPYDRNYRNRY